MKKERFKQKTKLGGVSGDYLRQYVDRIERLTEEKQAIGDTIKDVFQEAKANGFDIPGLRLIIKLRRMEKEKREEQEAIVETYKHALGMSQASFDFNSVTSLTRGEPQMHLEDFTSQYAKSA